MPDHDSTVAIDDYTIVRPHEDLIVLRHGGTVILRDERIKWPDNIGPALDAIADEIDRLRAENTRLNAALDAVTTAIDTYHTS